MAQTGYTPILIYASGTASAVPSASNLTSSASGAELALNYADGKLYFKNSGGTVTLLASAAGASGDVVGPSSATDNALARFDTTTGKLIQNSVGILSDAGVLTGLTGLTSSGNITLSSLTSGRLPYASTGGLLVDSANLTFNGTTLTAGGLTTTGTTSTGVLSVTGNTTLGDASADTVTINGTITSNLIFTDSTYDIGASGATRPRNLYLSNALTAGSSATIGSSATVGTYFAVGGNIDSGVSIYARNTNLSGTAQYGALLNITASSAASTAVLGVSIRNATAAAAFTTGYSAGIEIFDTTKGAGSTITSQYGVYVNDMTVGASNYGVVSNVSSGSNKWNIYSGGTATNFFNGSVGVGTNNPSAKLHIEQSAYGTGLIVGWASGTTSQVNIGVGVVTAGRPFIGTNNNTNPLEIGTQNSADVIFVQNSTEAGRFDSSKNFLVNTTQAITGSKISVENAGFSAGSSANSNQTNLLLSGYGYRSGSTTYGNTSIRSTYSNSTNAASLEFYVGTSGTSTIEAGRFASNGSLLLLSTSNPDSASLYVASTSVAGNWTDASFGPANSYRSGFIHMGSSSGYYGTGVILACDTGSTQGGNRIVSRYSGANSPALVFEYSTSSQSYGSNPLSLTYAEGMRFTPTGQLLIGKTSGNTYLNVYTSFDYLTTTFTSGAGNYGYLALPQTPSTTLMLVDLTNSNNGNLNASFLLLVNTRNTGFGGGNGVTVVSSTQGSTGTSGEISTYAFAISGSGTSLSLRATCTLVSGSATIQFSARIIQI